MEKSNTAGLFTRPAAAGSRPPASCCSLRCHPRPARPARHSDSTSCYEFPGWKLKDQKAPGRTMCKILHQHQQQHPTPHLPPPMESHRLSCSFYSIYSLFSWKGSIFDFVMTDIFFFSSRMLSQVFRFLTRDGNVCSIWGNISRPSKAAAAPVTTLHRFGAAEAWK